MYSLTWRINITCSLQQIKKGLVRVLNLQRSYYVGLRVMFAYTQTILHYFTIAVAVFKLRTKFVVTWFVLQSFGIIYSVKIQTNHAVLQPYSVYCQHELLYEIVIQIFSFFFYKQPVPIKFFRPLKYLRLIDSRYNVNDQCEKCTNVIRESRGEDKMSLKSMIAEVYYICRRTCSSLSSSTRTRRYEPVSETKRRSCRSRTSCAAG